MLTFREFRDSEDDGDDERAMEVVRKGMNLQRGNDFWEDFLRLCGDSEGMAALLGVARDRVTGLSGRVERLKGMVGDPEKKRGKRDRMIKTGEEV
jgi:hypothetical protein